MGIDKARFVTTLPVRETFMDSLNVEWLGRPTYPSYKISAPNLEGQPLSRAHRIQLATRPGSEIFFFLQLNFSANRKESPRNVLELNPNNVAGGIKELFALLDSVFEHFHPALFRVSRLDLNADVCLPVDQIFQTLYVPPKRKGESHLLTDREGRTRRQFKRFLTGFYIGSSPAMLRVYDKLEELKSKKKSISEMPDPLTRLEFEFRHHKCPVRDLTDISRLAAVEPFRGLQFFKFSPQITYEKQSVRRTNLQELVRSVGMHQAIRSLNGDRHFRRDYEGILEPMPEMSDLLQRAYLEGVKRFLLMK
jgi:hypothetical protein